MTKLFLLAGAALVAASAPAAAKPGHGHANAHATHHSRYVSLRDANHNRIDDRDEALARRYGGRLCPPGLYKKTPACVPPGQAKRLFRQGQRVSSHYRYITPYSSIPQALIDRYDLNPNDRYIYRNNVIYVVDPRTSLVERIINAIL